MLQLCAAALSRGSQLGSASDFVHKCCKITCSKPLGLQMLNGRALHASADDHMLDVTVITRTRETLQNLCLERAAFV